MITGVGLGVFGQDLDFIARSLQPRGHGLKQLRGRRARNYAELVVCGRGSLLGLGTSAQSCTAARQAQGQKRRNAGHGDSLLEHSFVSPQMVQSTLRLEAVLQSYANT